MVRLLAPLRARLQSQCSVHIESTESLVLAGLWLLLRQTRDFLLKIFVHRLLVNEFSICLYSVSTKKLHQCRCLPSNWTIKKKVSLYVLSRLDETKSHIYRCHMSYMYQIFWSQIVILIPPLSDVLYWNIGAIQKVILWIKTSRIDLFFCCRERKIESRFFDESAMLGT